MQALNSHDHIDLGDEPAIVVGGSDDANDRRKVSWRWLSGTVLTGFTAIFLIGGALYAAVEGRIELTTPLAAMTLPEGIDSADGAEDGRIGKADKVRIVVEKISARQRIEVSTLTRLDDTDVIKKRPFVRVKSTMLYRRPVGARKPPPFDPLKIFSDASTDRLREASDTIYSANVDGKLTVTRAEFPLASPLINVQAMASEKEVEIMVRRIAPYVEQGKVEASILPELDAKSIETDYVERTATRLPFRVVTENVTTIAKSDEGSASGTVDDVVVKLKKRQKFADLLTSSGLSKAEADKIRAMFALKHRIRKIDDKTDIRLALESDPADPERTRPLRVSLYDGRKHLATAAVNDNGDFIDGIEPPKLPEKKKKKDGEEEVAYAGPPLTVFQSVYETGFDQNIPDEVISDLVRILAFDVDFNSRVKPTDSLEVFYSDTGGAKKAEILNAAITINGQEKRYYRFRTPDDKAVDYYDRWGKSAKKFLMRKPVSHGRFGSPYGPRRHPILGIVRMHRGIDWKAKRGTPIMAAGDGVLKEVKWKSGYGRYVKIRHANGYETGYAHMSGWAKGIKAGKRVFQGQVIGYVGTTGLSTGPHLHFEVQVNNRHVDPMRIRLPRGRTLKGDVLQAFDKERDHIDQLLGITEEKKVASR